MNFIHKVKNLFFGGDNSQENSSSPQQQQQPSSRTEAPTASARKAPRSGHAYGKPSAPTSTGRPEPVLRETGDANNGGVQGLTWYAASQQQDHHGDFANEFLDAEAAAGGGGPAGTFGRQFCGGKRKAGNGAPPPATRQARQSLSVKGVQQGKVVLGPE